MSDFFGLTDGADIDTYTWLSCHTSS